MIVEKNGSLSNLRKERCFQKGLRASSSCGAAGKVGCLLRTRKKRFLGLKIERGKGRCFPLRGEAQIPFENCLETLENPRVLRRRTLEIHAIKQGEGLHQLAGGGGGCFR